jgi:trans-2,3-dihydro-3-hydroxyanthranilate isomerase
VRRYRFVTVDVFTDTRFGGNPLAVFPDAQGISDAEMQALAAEFNLSETTFVLPPSDPANTARVRIFNRRYEMPFAGHPNVGTGYVLAEAMGGDTLRFEEIAGLVEIAVQRDAAGSVLATTIAAPQPLTLGAELPPVAIAHCAGIEPWEVVTERHAPVMASVGNPFVIAELAPAALSRATPDLAAFRNTVGQWPVLEGRLALYMYAREGAKVRARMFAPLSGTVEDAATGSAATPLAALLLKLDGGGDGAWDITQGVEMGRPSLLRTAARRAPDGIRATVGGGCVHVLEGQAIL